MIKQKQLFRHNPDAGTFGDCHRTVLACLLDLPHDQVPHFAERHFLDIEAWNAAEKAFLASHGLASITAWYQGDTPLQQVLDGVGLYNQEIYYILGGTSRGGTNHSVIGLGNKIEWDPSLDDTGIIGPMDNGCYGITYLVPLRFTTHAQQVEL